MAISNADLLEFGYLSHQLRWFADGYWLNASPEDPFPVRVRAELEALSACVDRLVTACGDRQLRDGLEGVKDAAQRVYGAMTALWQRAEHMLLIQEREEAMGDLPTNWSDSNSILTNRAWEDFDQALRRAKHTLSAAAAICFDLGSLLSQVFLLGFEGQEQSSRHGYRFPIHELRKLLEEARDVLPELHDLDTDFSELTLRSSGVSYWEVARGKAVELRQQIAQRLSQSDARRPEADGPSSPQEPDASSDLEGAPPSAPSVGGEAELPSLRSQTYCRDLVGNVISDPSTPLSAWEIGTSVFPPSVVERLSREAIRKRALRLMTSGRLRANIAGRGLYVVNMADLQRLRGQRGQPTSEHD